MKNLATIIVSLFFVLPAGAQTVDVSRFLPDSIFGPASISLTIADLKTGEVLCSIDPNRALTPASIMKLISSSAALELLGPDYMFRTTIGYSGQFNKKGNILTGDIIIKGGGDPTLGSANFPEHNVNLIATIDSAISAMGIEKINGRIISDDRIYDFNPASSRWSWGDLGNYYGAGPYGISLFDNTFGIYLKTGPRGSAPLILRTAPEINTLKLTSYLISEGTTDRGYVYSAPYGSYGWISGFVPEEREEFVLKASIPDPPLMLATLVRNDLLARGIQVEGEAATARTINDLESGTFVPILELKSPPLSDIIHLLVHESINLYAEHMLKQVGYETTGMGTASSGIEVVRNFLTISGIPHNGVFIEDGSGLAPRNGISSQFMVNLIRHMVLNSVNSDLFRNALPPAGEDGTMLNYFRDPVFRSNLRAKTGTLARVRSYAGVFTSASGKEYAFCIIVNNYVGNLSPVNRSIEEMFKYLLINN
jgi:serine-type D-Ala-D-Ala carboxypeptidase/endopeptidase (penicillin-binding protein 4)